MRNETETKQIETKQIETKQIETKQIETKRNKSKRFYLLIVLLLCFLFWRLYVYVWSTICFKVAWFGHFTQGISTTLGINKTFCYRIGTKLMREFMKFSMYMINSTNTANMRSNCLSKTEKAPRGIRGEKSSKDMASSRNLVSTIGA